MPCPPEGSQEDTLDPGQDRKEAGDIPHPGAESFLVENLKHSLLIFFQDSENQITVPTETEDSA